MKENKEIGLIVGIVLFAVYFFCAARPIPLETVLVPRWLNSVESGTPVSLNSSLAQTDDEADGALSGAPSGAPSGNLSDLLPFSLGSRFGYVSLNGRFSVNQEKKANVSLSPERWAEYGAEPASITIHGNDGGALAVLENPSGYPFFLDGRTFLVNREQNAISAVDESGAVYWTYEFASPLTCIDSASGLVLTGSLDGVAGVLDSGGRQVFSFEPGGSRYSIILGCAMSRDGSRLAIVSGIDNQRFLVLERFGTASIDYKVIYHEFLGNGFRRPVHVAFIEGGRWVVFERSGGLGFYEISSRQVSKVELNGEISALDQSGGQGMVFAVITDSDDLKKLAGIRLPGRVIIESSFRSDEVFLGRVDSRLIVGGGQTLVSFDLEKK